MPHAFIVGGTGQIGLAASEHLLDNGWTVTAAHRGSRPAPPALVARGVDTVTMDRDKPGEFVRALSAGALGYIPKSTTSKTLLSALQLVLQGAVYVPPLMAAQPPAPVIPPAEPVANPGHLTERQIEVLRLIERGLSNKEIGLALNLSEKTVKVHVTGIFKALNVVTRTQAASAERAAGLV